MYEGRSGVTDTTNQKLLWSPNAYPDLPEDTQQWTLDKRKQVLDTLLSGETYSKWQPARDYFFGTGLTITPTAESIGRGFAPTPPGGINDLLPKGAQGSTNDTPHSNEQQARLYDQRMADWVKTDWRSKRLNVVSMDFIELSDLIDQCIQHDTAMH